MKAKLALALALAHRPTLLLLDEPTAGLDPVARREFLDLITDQAERSGRTTFFSSHILGEVERVADRVGIVDGGRMRYEGELADLERRVKLLRGAALEADSPLPFGPELEVLQDRRREGAREVVVFAKTPDALERLGPSGSPWTIESLSLEDIFIGDGQQARPGRRVTRRLAALVVKELRSEGLAILALAGLLVLALAALTYRVETVSTSISVFEQESRFLWTFVPLAALLLAHRLVVAEWHGRTQLFLEALPVRRSELVLVKLAFGLGVLELTVATSLAWTAHLAMRTEPVNARFLAILAARASLATAAVWSFFFVMGLLGRLRVPVYAAIVLLARALDTFAQVDLTRFGPFGLISGSSFPFERTDFPVHALAVTAALFAGAVTLAVLLVNLNEGSLAEVLSRRMSQKEKFAATVVVIGAIFTLWMHAERRGKKPYEFSDSAVLRSARLPIALRYEDPERLADAHALLATLERDLGELAPLLEDGLPPVRISYAPYLDPRKVEVPRLDGEEDGLLVRANFARQDGWDPRSLEARVVAGVTLLATKRRAEFEPRRWVQDGFARWWVEREDVPRSPDSLRALWATRVRGPSAGDLSRWTATRERLGEPVAESLATSGLRALEAARGREAVLALAREVLGRRSPDDAREFFRERANPFPVVFERATGLGWDAFLESWRRWLDARRADPATRERLGSVPDVQGGLRVAQDGVPAHRIQFRFEFASPPPAGTKCSLVAAGLGAFDWPIADADLWRDERVASCYGFESK